MIRAKSPEVGRELDAPIPGEVVEVEAVEAVPVVELDVIPGVVEEVVLVAPAKEQGQGGVEGSYGKAVVKGEGKAEGPGVGLVAEEAGGGVKVVGEDGSGV